MKVFAAIVLAAVAVAVSALSAEQERRQLALQNPDLYQGDILGFEPGDRNVIPGKSKRWPKGVVPYTIDISLRLRPGVKAKILAAMKNYETKTCIRFKERKLESPYINIFRGQGCYSYVGMVGVRKQPLSLGDGCHYVGTIVHELGHALGFFHEQNRSDRDKYLTIYYENIERGMEDQFALLKPYENLLLTPFDYDSIMLYGNYAFSKDGYSMTMKAKNGKRLVEPYDKGGMSKDDIKRINEMYNCDDDDDEDDDE